MGRDPIHHSLFRWNCLEYHPHVYALALPYGSNDPVEDEWDKKCYDQNVSGRKAKT